MLQQNATVGTLHEKENAMSKEEESKPSPIKAAHKGPVKGNPHPAKGK